MTLDIDAKQKHGVKDEEEIVVVTSDKMVLGGKEGSEVDKKLLSDGGLVEIKDMEEFKELAEAAVKTKNLFDETVEGMTIEEARMIRYWRVEVGGTWRWVAGNAYDEGICGGNWQPPSNQLMGMALCEKAASFFDEDYMGEPWN